MKSRSLTKTFWAHQESHSIDSSLRFQPTRTKNSRFGLGFAVDRTTNILVGSFASDDFTRTAFSSLTVFSGGRKCAIQEVSSYARFIPNLFRGNHARKS